MYKKMKEQSVKSSPNKLRWDNPWSQVIGVNGSFATTLPSKIELNIESKDVNAKPMANMDFIFTIIKSRFVLFNRSSSRSIFLF